MQALFYFFLAAGEQFRSRMVNGMDMANCEII